MLTLVLMLALLSASQTSLSSTSQTPTEDAALLREQVPKQVTFVDVEPGVRLEVLDWGGTGPALILLAGSGNTAHVFESFAPLLTNQFHVYGITRRGYGASSAPTSGYTPNRLGDDIVTVIDALKIKRPLLVGHSIAGEELSSIGSRYPTRVAGLIYLDAAYPFAYQNPNKPNLSKQCDALFKEAEAILPPQHLTSEDLASTLALQQWLYNRYGIRFPLGELRAGYVTDSTGRITGQKASPITADAIHDHQQAFSSIQVPILAIYAIPHTGKAFQSLPRAQQERFRRKEVALLDTIQNDFQAGEPAAKVIRIADANHYVFLSNPEQVLIAIRQFAMSDPDFKNAGQSAR